MPLQHARVDPSKPGLTLVDESGTAHSFTWAQVREYIRFDRDLRAGLISAVNLILPGGYALFVMLWNADSNCIYQFSGFDPATNSTTVRGAPFPNHLIDELDPPPAVPDVAPAEPQFTRAPVHSAARRRCLLHYRLYRRPRCRRWFCSSGSTTILSSAAARGSGSSGIATGSSSGSSAHSNTTPRREGSPMEEDKDAEGENDTELLSFSDDEGTDKKKAGKGKKRSE
ncbi:hypothetical protein LXA43DRAFT_977202 [Ganoderma leucocontextum]|nr:hypothetical protein LXA43DRAFT_977202 [Ganoderma leucocontextum]